MRMHKNFAEWYRLVRIEPNGDILKNRWAAIEEWSASFEGDDDAVLETVRIFHDLPPVTSREPFLAVFRKHDPAFLQRDNELEQRVLAGATLLQSVLTHDDHEEALRAAVIAGTALAASRLRATNHPLDELTDEVLAGLHALATHHRRRRGFKTNLLSDDEKKTLAKTIATEVADHSALRASFATAFETMLKAVQRSESALANAAHDLRCADEETNILWWLEGGCSRDLNKPWNALKDEVPLTAGCELADLTEIALGPREVAAFLHRVVSPNGKSKEQPLYAYVNAVSQEWAKARAVRLPEQVLDLTPLSLALLQRARSDTSSWQQYFEKTSGVAAAKQLAPEVAAKQAYTEAVLLRTLAETEA
jgi:hypothetical protein